MKLRLPCYQGDSHDVRVDILDPDLTARIGELDGSDADSVRREARALFIAGLSREDARDLARALHWLLRGQPRTCPATQLVRILAGDELSDAQCDTLGFVLNLTCEADRRRRQDALAAATARVAAPDGVLAELLTLGRRLGVALELLRRSDYFLSEMYGREELLIS